MASALVAFAVGMVFATMVLGVCADIRRRGIGPPPPTKPPQRTVPAASGPRMIVRDYSFVVLKSDGEEIHVAPFDPTDVESRGDAFASAELYLDGLRDAERRAAEA